MTGESIRMECQACGGHTIIRANWTFARCGICGATDLRPVPDSPPDLVKNGGIVPPAPEDSH